MAFTLRRSTQNLHVPSVFLTKTTGLVTWLVLTCTIPQRSIMATCSWRNSCWSGLNRLAPCRRGSAASSTSSITMGVTFAGASSPKSARQTSKWRKTVSRKRGSTAGGAPARAARCSIASMADRVAACWSASETGPANSQKSRTPSLSSPSLSLASLSLSLSSSDSLPTRSGNVSSVSICSATGVTAAS